MEESLKELKEVFQISGTDAGAYSPLTLAYIGDAVFELLVRYIVISRMKVPVAKLHAVSSHIVCAGAQSEMIAALEGELTGEELRIFRRGRNAKSNTMAKNASITDYRRATGFEAVIGYLFLQENYGRLIQLSEKAILSIRAGRELLDKNGCSGKGNI